jgi:putative salt-induced outer membrane protein YdiY
MKKIFRTSFLSLSLLGLLSGDQVVLKNGDRVTGSIVKKDAKQITIQTDMFGLVSTDWDKVASIVADKPLNVVLPDGKTVVGTLRESGGKVEIASTGSTIAVAPQEIAAIRNGAEQKAFERLLQPGWLDLWAGGGSIGFAGTSGNAKTTTFTTGLTAARITRTDKTSIYFNTIKASALINNRSAGTAEAVRGGLGYSRNLKPRLFANVFNDYEYDKFQNLDLRTVFGGGLGFKAIKSDRMTLDLLGGGAFNYSRFNTPLIRKTGEFYWGDDFTYKLNASTSLFQSYRMFNDLKSPGTYRINFDLGATTKISKYLVWNVSISDRYLTNPAPGRKTNDLLYTTGLGITFAR